MDVPAPRPEPAPPSRAPATQRALAALIGGAVVWLVVHTALQGSLALRRGPEPGQAPPSRLDLNQATVAELQLLPGVGPKLAQRIDAYRVLYGPYPHVDELRKVPGIGPQLLERIRPHVIVLSERREEMLGPPPVVASGVQDVESASKKGPDLWTPSKKGEPPFRKSAHVGETLLIVDVNNATIEELDQLPGIGPKLAQRIIDARTDQPFAVIEDLRRVPGIGPKTLDKLRPYVIVMR